MKYSVELTQEIAKWVEEHGLMDFGGATLDSLLQEFGIDKKTYYNWMRKSTFSTALQNAREVYKESVPQRAERSLMKTASGYFVDEVSTEERRDDNGKPLPVKRVINKRWIKADTAALIFLLTNLDPDRWQNKYKGDVDVKQVVRQETRTREEIMEDLKRLEENRQVAYDEGNGETE